MKKAALISLGCAKNLVDSEVMLGHLEKSGFTIHPDPATADIVIINTCGFIREAREESEQQILRAVELKRERGPKRLVVAGCYVEREEEALKEKFPEVDFWTGVRDFHHIAEIVESRLFQPSKRVFLYDHLSPRRRSTSPAFAYVKISEGCSHRCGFCAIPLIKGPYRSRPKRSILAEAEDLATRGVREIVLISQDSTAYGVERGDQDGLSDLLESLRRIHGGLWLRVLYAYPERITDRLIDVMGEQEICSYFDLPFQHADPGILRKMGRGLDGQAALELVGRIRTRIPDAVFRTSLIVGFPNEGPGEFAALKIFIQKAELDHLGIFIYSPEPGTPCFPLGDPVSAEEKTRRRDELMNLQAGISRKLLKKYIGRRLDVLIEGGLKGDPDILVGRTRYQAPEVDGLVFIDQGPRALPRSGPLQTVEITHSEVYDLFGVVKE